MNNKAAVVFVKNGKKFPQCTSFNDITSTVTCKEVSGLAGVDLTAGGGCLLLSWRQAYCMGSVFRYSGYKEERTGNREGNRQSSHKGKSL